MDPSGGRPDVEELANHAAATASTREEKDMEIRNLIAEFDDVIDSSEDELDSSEAQLDSEDELDSCEDKLHEEACENPAEATTEEEDSAALDKIAEKITWEDPEDCSSSGDSEEEDIDAMIDRALQEDPGAAHQVDIFSPMSLPEAADDEDEEDSDAMIDRALQEDPGAAHQVDIFSPMSLPEAIDAMIDRALQEDPGAAHQMSESAASDAETMILGEHLQAEEAEFDLPAWYGEPVETEDAGPGHDDGAPPAKRSRVRYHPLEELADNPHYNQVPCEFSDGEDTVHGHILVKKERAERAERVGSVG